MRKGKFWIGLISALILLAIVAMAIRTAPVSGSEDPVSVRAGEERLKLWTPDGENYYAFLPGHIRPEEAQLISAGENVTLDGKALPISWGELEQQGSCVLSWEENGESRQATLHLLEGENVASLYLDTQSGSMGYIHEKKGNAERGSLRLYDESGTLDFSGSLSSVAGRGNSTWVVHEKKPYSLELTEEADLLGMGAAKKWVLLADALDPSALRNRIVYGFAAQTGIGWTPETRWTEVWLNGEYAGLYLLCEKPEIDPERLDLTADGSLVCMDRDIRILEDTQPYFVTEKGQYLQVRDSADIGALTRKFQVMERALLSRDDAWKDYIDTDSWARKYLIEEVFGSYDAGFQSQFFFCPDTAGEGKIYAGPIWDYDSSLGNPLVWSLNSPQGLFAWRPEAVVEYPTPWLRSLYEKEEFRTRLQEIYRSEFLPLLETLTEETVDAYAQTVQTAFDRNRIRWNVQTEGIMAEAESIRSYLRQRTEFLNRFLLEEQEFCILRLRENQLDGYYGYYAVEPGAVFADLPRRSEPDFLGWYREDTGERFDPEMPVTEDLCLYPKYEGEPQVRPPREKGLRDFLVEVYHYVPAAVLVLMGLAAVPAAMWKSRGKNHKKQKTEV